MNYPMIDIAGTPREMGISHGRQLADRIRRTSQAMRDRIGKDPYETSWQDFEHTVDHCREVAPRLIEEMEGIAQGAGISFRDVFLINAHLDLNVWKRVIWNAPEEEPDACSSHALNTPNGVYLGWNGDDWTGWMDCGAIIRGRPDEELPFIYWSLAGSVGRPGMNTHLALGANSLPSPGWRAEGLLYPMLSRLLLSCRSANDCVTLLQATPSCSAMNYVVADRAGSLANIEVGSEDIAVQTPEDHGASNLLLHTNCYLDAELAGHAVDPDTVCPRLGTARELYRKCRPQSVEEISDILSDHTGGICVHREGAATIVSFVAEVHLKRIHVITGNPCQGASVRVDLPTHQN
jgi:isopenicillin-N N-acyltransferase-like protein